MKKTGQLLKQKRESDQLTLSEVALATKINPKILVAIENGDESNLPAKTFLKGFVRSYALFLKMDVDEVLRCFVDDTGGPPPPQNHEAYQKDAPISRRGMPPEGSSGLRTAAIVVIVALICAIIGVRELVDKYQREKLAASTPADVKVSPLAETKPVAPAKENAPVKESAPAKDVVAANPASPKNETLASPFAAAVTSALYTPVASEAAGPAPVEPNIPKALEQPPVGHHELASVASPKAPAPVAAAPAAPAPATDSTPAATAEITKPGDAAKAPTPAAATGNEVIIEALDRVQVKVFLGAEVKSIDLNPNDVHVVRSPSAIALEVSDGGAVSLVYNGRVRGAPGKLGEPKQVKLP